MRLFPANQRESDIILNYLKRQPCEYQEIGLDGGYDIGAVHRGLEFQKLIYKKATQNYSRLNSRSKNNVKNDHGLSPVQPIWVP